MTRNLLRVVILVWLAVSIRSGFVRWSDHESVIAQGISTEANPSGLTTEFAEFSCRAPIGGGGDNVLVSNLVISDTPNGTPCESYRSQRQALFWVDIVFALVGLAITFAHVPKRFVAARRSNIATA